MFKYKREEGIQWIGGEERKMEYSGWKGKKGRGNTIDRRGKRKRDYSGWEAENRGFSCCKGKKK